MFTKNKIKIVKSKKYRSIARIIGLTCLQDIFMNNKQSKWKKREIIKARDKIIANGTQQDNRCILCCLYRVFCNCIYVLGNRLTVVWWNIRRNILRMRLMHYRWIRTRRHRIALRNWVITVMCSWWIRRRRSCWWSIRWWVIRFSWIHFKALQNMNKWTINIAVKYTIIIATLSWPMHWTWAMPRLLRHFLTNLCKLSNDINLLNSWNV